MEAEPAAIDPTLHIGSVKLAVSDLPRSVDFYERVLGLPSISHDEDGARLGVDPHRPLLELTALDHATAVPAGSTGLFHVALLHPSRAALAATVQRVARGRWPIDGAADHGVSEALYLSDPDGLGIEIYADRPREQWERPPGGHGVVMVTLPLDLDSLLSESPEEPADAMPPGTAVGHVHLRVADVPRAIAFYEDALGFDEQALLPSAAFLSAGGYHHHVGLNSWQSKGGSPAPDSAPGLRAVVFELGGADRLAALERRLTDRPVGSIPVDADQEHLTTSDPDGHRLVFLSNAARVVAPDGA